MMRKRHNRVRKAGWSRARKNRNRLGKYRITQRALDIMDLHLREMFFWESPSAALICANDKKYQERRAKNDAMRRDTDRKIAALKRKK